MSALFFTVSSCNKDSIFRKSEDKIVLRDKGSSNAEVYNIRKAFAETFYKAMASEAGLRSFIYEKCQKADTYIIIEGYGEVGYSYTGSPVVELGNAPVFYCDPIKMVNNTGSISFICD